VSQENRRRTGS